MGYELQIGELLNHSLYSRLPIKDTILVYLYVIGQNSVVRGKNKKFQRCVSKTWE